MYAYDAEVTDTVNDNAAAEVVDEVTDKVVKVSVKFFDEDTNKTWTEPEKKHVCIINCL